MTKSLYYIECTAKTDFHFKNSERMGAYTDFHIGDILWYNNNASAYEMYVVPYTDNIYRAISSTMSYLPFTRQKRYAKKYQIKKKAEQIANIINNKEQFIAVVKEIKLTYEEEEV